MCYKMHYTNCFKLINIVSESLIYFTVIYLHGPADAGPTVNLISMFSVFFLVLLCLVSFSNPETPLFWS